MESVKNRVREIDALKFILIFSVMVGHCLTFGKSDYLNNIVYRFIYSFHMPLFVFLSGMFFRKKENKKMLLGLIPLISAYFIFQIITPGKFFGYNGGGIRHLWKAGLIR